MKFWGIWDTKHDGRIVFVYYTHYLQGRALAHWKAVVAQHAKENSNKMYAK